MSTRSKKFDDPQDEDTPATWIAKHAPSYRSAQKARRANHVSFSTGEKSWKQDRKEDDDNDAYMSCCDLEDETSCPAMTARLPQSKPFRRVMILLLGVFALGYFCWKQAIAPMAAADWDIREGFLRTIRGTYGFAQAGDFDAASVRTKTIDQALLPGGASDLDGKRRLVFVGDIHGCKDELQALLKACAFDEERDHLITTGDVISKGPDTPGVIDVLLRLEATSVRGNHEDRILTLVGSKVDTKINQAKDVTAASKKDQKLVKSLQARHIAYLRQTPLILRIPPLPLVDSFSKATHPDTISTEVLAVHAGLVPAVPLDRQDPYYVMNMRSLGRRTHVPSAQPASRAAQTVPWIELWDWYQDRLAHRDVPYGWHNSEQQDEAQSWTGKALSALSIGRKKPQPQVVVYGHDSREGLKIKRWTKGLDSSCVKGGQLTAMVLDAHGQTELVSVKCKHYLS